MSLTVTAIVGADTLFQLVCQQHPSRLGNRPFAVYPLWLDRVQPGALARQAARDEAHALPRALHLPIMRTDPAPYVLARVPGGVIPDQKQASNPLRRQLLTTPGQKVGRDGADWATSDEAQQHLVVVLRSSPHQEAVTGQRLGILVVRGPLQFLQPEQGVVIDPAVLVGLGQPAPPDLIGKAQSPTRMIGRQADQPVAPFFSWRTPGRDW
jgi:hypothetical protein